MFLDFAGTLVNLDHVAQVEPYTPGGGRQLVVILSNGNRVGVKDGERAVELLHAINLHVNRGHMGAGDLTGNGGRWAFGPVLPPKPTKKGKK